MWPCALSLPEVASAPAVPYSQSRSRRLARASGPGLAASISQTGSRCMQCTLLQSPSLASRIIRDRLSSELHFWQERRIHSTVAPARNWPSPPSLAGILQSAALPSLTANPRRHRSHSTHIIYHAPALRCLKTRDTLQPPCTYSSGILAQHYIAAPIPCFHLFPAATPHRRTPAHPPTANRRTVI
jgi:hypothetical protein